MSQWNSLIAAENIFETSCKNARSTAITRPTHVVIHITGEVRFEAVKQTFLKQTSAHYVIKKDGTLCQFVRDKDRAWHAGIERSVAALYRLQPERTWMNYLRFHSWYRGYPKDSEYLTADLDPSLTRSESTFVRQSSKDRWIHYDYFVQRWPQRAVPVNFEVDSDPNNYSIGIECVSEGSRKANSEIYTDKMYASLRHLIQDLSEKYEIPLDREHIVGHEDVNPITRFGWDPDQGFEWPRLLTAL